ncbi:hypothetical protein ACS0TY_029123 [Phlomoides rotata]
MEKNEPQTIYHMDENLESPNLLETDLTVESLIGCPKAAVESAENISEVNVDTKNEKVLNKIGTKTKLQDEIQDVSQTKMDTGSTENLAEKNVNGKRKRRRKRKAKNKVDTGSMHQVDGMLNLHLSDGNHGEGIDGMQSEKACTSQEFEVSVRKEPSLSGAIQNKENPLDSCMDEEAEVSVRKGSPLSDPMHDKENPLDLCKKTVLLPDVVEVSSKQLVSEVVEDRSENVLRSIKVDGKLIPRETQISTHLNQVTAVNPKPENGLNEVNDEIVVYTGRCSAESRSVFSTCDIKVIQHPSSDVNKAECLSKDIGQYPRIQLNPSLKRKLIVLDVNGLLANIIMPAPKDYKEDVRLLGRAIFKRPFCDDFLKFCFQNFDVGVWSSRSKKIIDRVVEYLLGDLNDKLLFCWDMSHSTQTGFRTVENIHKPLVFKELKKIWENDDPNLPWKNGDYNESNTLLLDDSPYKALLNPLHTAIFPNSYDFKDENDNSLGKFRVNPFPELSIAH